MYRQTGKKERIISRGQLLGQHYELRLPGTLEGVKKIGHVNNFMVRGVWAVNGYSSIFFHESGQNHY